MRVTRVQAEENRQTVIDVANRLFRQHGFDGIGLKDLMAGAEMTQGAFYKQFESKEDLAAQASRRGLENALRRWSAAAATNPNDPLSAVVDFYLSLGHCAEKADGCPVVALGSDAARHGTDVKASFQAGIQEYLDLLDGWIGGADGGQSHSKSMAVLSTMVGAVLLARAVNDRQMSTQFLQAAASSAMAQASATPDKADPRQ
jgi:TetR/AcrR family transcriptional repressor of nem operon